MAKVKDIKGKRFGRLTVIKLTEERDKSGHTMWECKCDCGGIAKVSRSNLISGGQKSCSCGRIHHHLPRGIASFRLALRIYKKSAKNRKLEWSLTDKEAKDIFVGNCYYCGASANCEYSGQKGLNGIFYRNGIDRIDNNKGYTKENSVSCCKTCNKMKTDCSLKEFVERVKKIYKYLN